MTLHVEALQEMLEETKEIRAGLERAYQSIEVITTTIHRILDDAVAGGDVETLESLSIELKALEEDIEEHNPDYHDRGY